MRKNELARSRTSHAPRLKALGMHNRIVLRNVFIPKLKEKQKTDIADPVLWCSGATVGRGACSDFRESRDRLST